MVNSRLEPLQCSVFSNSKWLIESCFPFIIIKCVFFYPKLFFHWLILYFYLVVYTCLVYPFYFLN